MFDIGADELLLTAAVAIVVIGPKDLPRALRVAGRWVGKMRRMSNAFRAGIENVIREAELEEMEQKWREQNAAIMADHPMVTADPDAEAQAAAAAAQGHVAATPTPEASRVTSPPVTDAAPTGHAPEPPREAGH